MTFAEVFKDFDPISPCPTTIAPPLVHSESSDSINTVAPATPRVEDIVLFSNPFDIPVFESDDEESDGEVEEFSLDDQKSTTSTYSNSDSAHSSASVDQ